MLQFNCESRDCIIGSHDLSYNVLNDIVCFETI